MAEVRTNVELFMLLLAMIVADANQEFPMSSPKEASIFDIYRQLFTKI